MTLNPYINDGFYDVSYLDNMPAVYEDTFIRHVRFNKPLEIIIDGRKHKGVIIKPS